VVSGYVLNDTVGVQGTGNGQFSNIQGIAISSFGDIFIADAGTSNRIQKISSDGQFITKWGSTGTGTSQFSNLRNLALLGDSIICAVDQINSRIQMFNLDGIFLKMFPIGVKTGQGDPSPYSIAVSDTFIYITDIERQIIAKYTWQGDSISAWAFPEQMDKGNAAFISCDTAGNIYLMQNVSKRAYVFNPDGQLVRQLNLEPLNLELAASILVDNNERILISDYDKNTINILDINGRFIGKLAVEKPSKIAIGSNKQIYTVSNSIRVLVFSR
jgi:streptogramin lyase